MHVINSHSQVFLKKNIPILESSHGNVCANELPSVNIFLELVPQSDKANSQKAITIAKTKSFHNSHPTLLLNKRL